MPKISRDEVLSAVHAGLLSSVYHADIIKNLLKRQLSEDVCLTFFVNLEDLTEFKSLVPPEGKNALIGVTENMAQALNLDIDTLYDASTLHDRYSVETMSTVLNRLSDSDYFEDSEIPMVCLSSCIDTNLFGASGILSKTAQHAVFDLLGTSDLYVLPSSIYEVLCVPKSDAYTPNELLGMIREINENMVLTGDRLSDSLFTLENGNLVSVSC